jgi:hypothetical protein
MRDLDRAVSSFEPHYQGSEVGDGINGKMPQVLAGPNCLSNFRDNRLQLALTFVSSPIQFKVQSGVCRSTEMQHPGVRFFIGSVSQSSWPNGLKDVDSLPVPYIGPTLNTSLICRNSLSKDQVTEWRQF